jgi:hypothetical protein
VPHAEGVSFRPNNKEWLMNINKFEKFIDRTILKRGEEYFLNDCIVSIEEIKPGKWKAYVEGSEKYRILISLIDGEITGSECNCPYEYGDICKHQVAVLFKLREFMESQDGKQKKGKRVEKRISRSEKIDMVLSKTDSKELAYFVKESALSDDVFFASLIAEFGLDANNIDRNEYRRIIMLSLDNAEDHGFIDYRNVEGSLEGADKILMQADTAVRKKNFPVAIAMAECAVEVLIPVIINTDDSSGSFSMTIDNAFDILVRCSESVLDEKIRKSFFRYCLNALKNEEFEEWFDWRIEFIRIAVNLSKDKAEIEDLLKTIDELISNKKSSYLYNKLSMIKYEIMKKSGNKKVAEDFFNKNLKIPEFRIIAIEKAIRKKDFVKAEKLAFEGERINKDKSGLVDEWKDYRLLIYKRMNDMVKYRELLKEFICDRDFDSYIKLKKTYDRDEWPPVFSILIEELIKVKYVSGSKFLMDIYVEENMKEDLLKEVKKRPGYIDEYERYLLKDYAGDIFEIYKRNILKESDHADKRSSYKRICDDIRHLIKLNEHESAREIVKMLNDKYIRRKAFIDELSKIRFK